MEQSKDTRDRRDPQALGMKLLELRQSLPNAPLSKMYDRHEKYLNVPDYDPQPPDHAKVRQQELEFRAAAGDRYAASLLNGKSLAEDPTD